MITSSFIESLTVILVELCGVVDGSIVVVVELWSVVAGTTVVPSGWDNDWRAHRPVAAISCGRRGGCKSHSVIAVIVVSKPGSLIEKRN